MSNELIKKSIAEDYKYGFETDVEQDTFPPGLDENVIRKLSNIKNEPEWLLEWRLKAYRHWLKMTEPNWANVKFNSIDYQSISYYSAPKKKSAGSLDEIDPEILATYTKLGIPLDEQKMMEGVAVDAVFDSVSVATTFKDSLKKAGVIFCPFSEAVQEHPELVKNIWDPWFLQQTIITLPSTQLSLVMVLLCIFQKGYAAQWNYPHILELMLPILGSLNAHLLWQMNPAT